MPHVVTHADGRPRSVVVVGAGPGGLEAARVAAARGHKTILMEAADAPGGQVRVAAGLARRREILGIVDWRVAQCEKHGVDLRTNVYAEAADVLREGPDVVIVATGGVPNLDFLREGADHATSSWDILTGAAKPAANVIVYDDNGAHRRRQRRRVLRARRRQRRLYDARAHARPRRRLDQLSALSARVFPVRRRRDAEPAARKHPARGQPARRRILRRIWRAGASSGSPIRSSSITARRRWTISISRSNRARAISARSIRRRCWRSRPQTLIRNAEGAYQLFRIGDAVASRNIHAAIYDALRLVCVM